MSKRILISAFLIVSIFTGLVYRIGYISFGNDYQISKEHNTKSVVVDRLKPTLYYRDYSKATNNKIDYVAVIRPNPKSVNELDILFNSDEKEKILNKLKQGFPVVAEVDKSKISKLKHIHPFFVYSSQNELYQLIDKSSDGLFNHIQNNIGKREVLFTVDALGRLLDGDDGYVLETNYNSKEGYRISIDKDIQQIAVNSSKTISNGCVIVMDINDNSILASVSKPFDSCINKSFSNYSVGSVFKIIVSLCALENHINPTFECVGKIKIGDTEFSCQKNHIHGKQNIKEALANSCNCYFVNLANMLGGKKITDTARLLGFDDEIELFDTWKIRTSFMPTEKELKQKGELSLFGFGQGKLVATPLQICSVLCTVSNGGIYNYPRFVLSNINNENKKTDINYPNAVRVLSKETCNKMIDYLQYVVTNGTGASAQTSLNNSAGKTATAQTGQFINQKEKLNTWFAGIYPADNPKYAIVIMNENGISGAEDCCPIYRTIVELLEKL